MSLFQPPPTYALPVLVDERTGKSIFHPIWLKWFVDFAASLSATGAGTVTNVSVTTANGVSGAVANPTSTPAITLALGVIAPTSVNKITFTTPATGATLTLVDGKTLTASKTMQLTAADDTGVYTLPTGTATLLAANTPITVTTLVTSGYTVAGLPAGTIGMRAYVTNALAPVYLAAVVGGGAVVCPVFYDGAAWIVG